MFLQIYFSSTFTCIHVQISHGFKQKCILTQHTGLHDFVSTRNSEIGVVCVLWYGTAIRASFGTHDLNMEQPSERHSAHRTSIRNSHQSVIRHRASFWRLTLALNSSTLTFPHLSLLGNISLETQIINTSYMYTSHHTWKILKGYMKQTS